MADVELLERFDSFAALRNGLRRVAADRGEWAGIPMPLDTSRLVIEPTYPKAKELMEIGRADEALAEGDELLSANVAVRGSFWSLKKRSEIVIYSVDGRITWGLQPGIHHLRNDLRTLGAADVWGIDQEQRALKLLGTLLRHRAFKQYLLTGMFIETSKRSGVSYLFRRLKPTVAIRNNRILCALCLHPIAHYEDSWAGAMCPTDDVIAHLMLMRGDEPMFWRRANQHPAWHPAAGIGS